MKEKQPFEKIVEALSELEYGSTILHTDIQRISGIIYGTVKYRSEMNKAKKALLILGKGIESVHGTGYRVIAPDDYLYHTARHMRYAANQMTKGQSYCDYAPLDKMSATARQATVEMQDKIATVAGFLNQQLPQVNRISRKKSPLEIAGERNKYGHGD